MAVVGQAQVLVVPTFTGLQKKIEKEFGPVGDGAGKEAGNSLGSSLAKWGKRGAVVAGGAIAAVMGVSLAKGMGRLKAIEEAQAKMRGLGHDGDAVRGIMDNALASVKGTAFGLGDAATVAASMVAAGIKPGEKLEATLKMVANSAAAAGTDLGEMGAIFGQVATTNTAYTGSLNQLANRGLPIYQKLAEQMGITESEVRKLASTGKIDFETFSAAATAAAGTVAEEMGTTLTGSTKNMFAALGRVGANFLSGIFPKFGEGIRGITDMLGPFEDKAKAIGERLSEWVSVGMDSAKALFDILFKGDYSGGLFGLAEDSPVVGILLTLRERAIEVADAAKGIFDILFRGDFTGGIFGLSEDSAFVDFLFELRENAIYVFGELKDGITAFTSAWQYNDGEVTSSGFPGFMERVGYWARQAFDYLKDTALPAVGRLAGWFNENRGAVVALAGAYGALRLAVVAHTAAMTVQRAGGFTAWLVTHLKSIRLVQVAMRTWTAVQWLLNAAMSANPIGIVIMALVALGAGLVLAYKKSETFRNVVQGAWAGIQAAVSYSWNSIIKPAFSALSGFITGTLAPAAMWLWNNVMKPAFAGISVAVKVAWAAIKIVFDVWKHYISNVVAPIVSWLWNSIIKPVFSSIGDHIKWAWNNVIKPVFKALGDFIRDTVSPAFSRGVELIRTAWDKIQEIARKPINFVIETVYNNGIKKVFDKIAEAVGSSTRMPYVAPIGSGSAPTGRQNASGVRARKRGGFTPRGWTLVGEEGPELVDFTSPGRVYTARQTRGMLGDGPVLGGLSWEGIKGAVAGARDWVLGNLRKAAGALLDPIRSLMSGVGGSGALGGILRGAVGKGIDMLLGFAGKEDEKGALGGGAFGRFASGWPAPRRGVLSSNTAAAAAFVRSAFGMGNIGTLGNRSNRSDHPMGKALDVMISNWNTNAGIAKGNQIASWFVNNPARFGTKYVIWRDQINSGSGWRPYVHPSGNKTNPTLRHMDHPHISLYDQGGWLPPGLSTVLNATGKPEAVFNQKQLAAMAGPSVAYLAPEHVELLERVANRPVVTTYEDTARAADRGRRTLERRGAL